MRAHPTLVPRIISTCLVFASRCQCSSFTPNCTLPTNGVNYVAGPNTRSTLTIVWNCISIIILCTWNIQHLNVPPVRRAEGIGKLWLPILASTTKLKWMTFTTFVPEYLVGKALSELFAMKAVLSDMRDKSYMVGKEWGTVHCYLANMGYFVLDVQPELGVAIIPTKPLDEEQKTKSTPEPGEETTRENGAVPDLECGEELKMLHALDRPEETDSEPTSSSQLPRALEPQLTDRQYVANEDNISIDSSPPPLPYEHTVQQILKGDLSASARINLHRLQHRFWALSASQWELAFGMNIATVPDIPSVYLEKLDRGGAIVKILAICQVTYLIIQLIARKVQGLPSSQLEIATLAFSVSSLVTYGLYWKHPQDVETIHFIPTTKPLVGNGRGISQMYISMLAKHGPSYMWHKPRTESKFDRELGPSPIPNDASHLTFGSLPKTLAKQFDSTTQECVVWTLGAVFGGIPFGGLHCLAWNFRFPTTAEAIAWRVCSVTTACLPLIGMAPILMWARRNPRQTPTRQQPQQPRQSLSRSVITYSILGILVLYVLARLFLLAEMIRCLFFLPPEAFVETWSDGFPHWG
ncbi:hypothetical protein F4804DRAFT_317492 [Jackrogersella minutella]|nr:hypothetical protein F4804DRAFT_317492 [Jackrogersella minutella]